MMNTGSGDIADMDVAHATDLNTSCASATFQAQQAPAAMLVVLDRSQSMADNNKYNFAAQAIVSAIDQDVFDTMYVGLLAAPSGEVTAPACLQQYLVASVSCGVPPFPQIDLTLAGMNKSSDQTGVRHKIKFWLSNNTPDQGAGDATPMYSAIQSGISALQNIAINGKRMLFVITDGSWDCAQLSNRPGYPDCNGCDHEWEKPQSVISLVSAANQDPQRPVETFIVGVPGADTYDQSGCMYPPYHMRAGLSAIAAAGSPNNVPANCTGKTFSDSSMDPAVSCHFDMTQGNFNAGALSDAIGQIRGKVLGCTFELPQPDGGTVDPDSVNVTYTVAGNTVDLKRRADKNNQCVNDGCWDYDASGKVLLIGKACDDVKTAPDAQVKIVVGCPTIIG